MGRDPVLVCDSSSPANLQIGLNSGQGKSMGTKGQEKAASARQMRQMRYYGIACCRYWPPGILLWPTRERSWCVPGKTATKPCHATARHPASRHRLVASENAEQAVHRFLRVSWGSLL